MQDDFRSLPRGAYILTGSLYLLSFALIVLHHVFNINAGRHPIIDNFMPLFDIHEENNIPTWYSTMLWATSSYLSALIGSQSNMRSMGLSRQWLSLSLVLLFMSLDEAASIHERIGDLIIILNGGKLSGAFYYEWVVYGIPMAAIICAFYVPMVIKLGGFTFIVFSLAAILFLTGALGLEMIQAAAANAAIAVPRWMSWRLGYAEELLEMVGIVTLIFGLLHLRANAELEKNTFALPRPVGPVSPPS